MSRAARQLRRRWQGVALRAELARRRRQYRAKVRDRGTCIRHEDLAYLWGEPVRGNPPPLVGLGCRDCGQLFTVSGAPSEPMVPTKPRLPGSPLRPSRAHAARLRAADRAGIRPAGVAPAAKAA